MTPYKSKHCFENYKVLSGGRVNGGHQEPELAPSGVQVVSFQRALHLDTPMLSVTVLLSRKGEEGCCSGCCAWHHEHSAGLT